MLRPVALRDTGGAEELLRRSTGGCPYPDDLTFVSEFFVYGFRDTGSVPGCDTMRVLAIRVTLRPANGWPPRTAIGRPLVLLVPLAAMARVRDRPPFVSVSPALLEH